MCKNVLNLINEQMLKKKNSNKIWIHNFVMININIYLVLLIFQIIESIKRALNWKTYIYVFF